MNWFDKMAPINSREKRHSVKLVQEVRPSQLSRCTDPVSLEKISSQPPHWLSLEGDAEYHWTIFTRLHCQSACTLSQENIKREKGENRRGKISQSLLSSVYLLCSRLSRIFIFFVCHHPPPTTLVQLISHALMNPKRLTDVHCGHSVLLF